MYAPQGSQIQYDFYLLKNIKLTSNIVQLDGRHSINMVNRTIEAHDQQIHTILQVIEGKMNSRLQIQYKLKRSGTIPKLRVLLRQHRSYFVHKLQNKISQ